MTDVVSLTIPAEPGWNGVAELVLAGLGARLDLPYDRIDELQLATSAVLADAAGTEVRGPGTRHGGACSTRWRTASSSGSARTARHGPCSHSRAVEHGDVASRDQRALLVAYLEEGDVAARDRLVEELMPLVRSLANRYAGRGEPTEDLVQVGAIGLVKAIDRFELEKGVELSTYAVPTIVGEIRRHFRDRTWAVHVPRRLKELSMKLSRTRDDLSAELGRSPTVAELAAAVGVDEEEASDALGAAKAYAPRSLDQPYDEDEPARVPGLADEERGYAALERGSVVRQGLDALDERERRIVVLRFLRGMSQSEIAAEVGISQMHVSRLLRKALEAMRGRLEEPEVPV